MAMDPERTSSPCITRVTRLSGNIEFRGLAKIEGEAEGEITGEEIEIAPSAVVAARITANRLKVGGQVEGDIVAYERIELLPTARLRCTITTPTLVISEGAQFDGDCKMHLPTTSPREAGHETNNDGVSFFITQAERATLRERGYSDNDIFRMKPADAHRLIRVQ